MKSIFFSGNGNICVISTYSTFKTDRFKNAFFKTIADKISTFTLIADEAHTMGSTGMIKSLPNNIPRRIGLSATPELAYMMNLGPMHFLVFQCFPSILYLPVYNEKSY